MVALDWAAPDFSTLSRRQKTLAVIIPYRGSKGPLNLLIRAAVLNGYTALGIPVTESSGYVRLGKGEVRASTRFRNKALLLGPF